MPEPINFKSPKSLTLKGRMVVDRKTGRMLSIVAFNYVGNEVGISIIAVCVKYTDVNDYDVLSALYIEENCEFV